MFNNLELAKAYAAEQMRRSHHPLRRIIKSFYLKNILSDVRGKTIDLGCGAGQLLARLPEGSLGLESNQFLVTELLGKKLNVRCYDIEADDFNLSGCEAGVYKTLVLCHVLEHFGEAAAALIKITQSAKRLGIERLIVVVPGKKGYVSDATHKTMVDRKFITDHDLDRINGFSIVKICDYPFWFEAVGDYFVYQELKIVFDAVQV